MCTKHNMPAINKTARHRFLTSTEVDYNASGGQFLQSVGRESAEPANLLIADLLSAGLIGHVEMVDDEKCSVQWVQVLTKAAALLPCSEKTTLPFIYKLLSSVDVINVRVDVIACWVY